MARRERGRTEIVPPHEVMGLPEIRQERWIHATLLEVLRTNEEALQWAARRRLVINTCFCGTCNQATSLSKFAEDGAGYRWRCKTCNFRRSVRSDSIFEKSRLTLKQIVCLLYLWSRDLPQKLIAIEIVASADTLVDWCNFIREECGKFVEREASVIGGVDENGKQMVVEIGESEFGKNKYHRGRGDNSRWVFGGVERISKKCFMVKVTDRTAHTLEELILKHIHPGSHIMSDEWPAYKNIANIPNGYYSHSVIVHKHNFVDPLNPMIHTQNIENLWMRSKLKLRKQFGTSQDLFQSYLEEFQFRNFFRRTELFPSLLGAIIENYGM